MDLGCEYSSMRIIRRHDNRKLSTTTGVIHDFLQNCVFRASATGGGGVWKYLKMGMCLVSNVNFTN